MAQSPTHKFGQIIGDMIERAMEDPLRECVYRNNNLYLDKRGPRNTRPGKQKVTWDDKFGNSHDLDFVIERGGDYNSNGKPVAFIEIAWRRYTKHSRNKVQEIQGAIAPLAETYSDFAPFKGVILSGVFTEGALTQLSSLGFEVCYFNYDAILDAFQIVGIDAFWDEDTPDAVVKQKVDDFEALDHASALSIEERLRVNKKNSIDNFINSLESSILRQINSIYVIPVHGNTHEYNSKETAINFVANYNLKADASPFIRFEIIAKYNNGDKVEATFQDKNTTINFLRKL